MKPHVILMVAFKQRTLYSLPTLYTGGNSLEEVKSLPYLKPKPGFSSFPLNFCSTQLCIYFKKCRNADLIR